MQEESKFDKHLRLRIEELNKFYEGLKELKVSMEANALQALEEERKKILVNRRERNREQCATLAKKAGYGKWQVIPIEMMEDDYVVSQQ